MALAWEGNWINTYLPLVVPMFFGNAFWIFLMRQFMMQIPQEISDAARIDGASEFRIFYQIVLPQALPAIGVISIFAGLHAWNDFLGPLIYLQDETKYTLAIGLTFFQSQREIQFSLLMAASTSSSCRWSPSSSSSNAPSSRASVSGASSEGCRFALRGEKGRSLRGAALAASGGEDEGRGPCVVLLFPLPPRAREAAPPSAKRPPHVEETNRVQPVRRAASRADRAAPGRAARLAQCPRAPDRGLVVHRRRYEHQPHPWGLLAGGRDTGPVRGQR